MVYDLARLFDHPLKFRSCIPSAIVTFGGEGVGDYRVQVQYRRSALDTAAEGELRLSWDVNAIRPHFADVEDEVDILRERDDDSATRIELAAVVVAVAVMATLEPDARFTRRSAVGTGHDYYLSNSRTEMIEVAGRLEGGLPGLFELKRRQSDGNPTLTRRWVSVTIFREHPRDRTEGLHR